MALEYISVQWNRQKRIYDFMLAGGVGAFLILFGVVSKVLFPLVTDEILLIRAFGSAAFLLLHLILCIGPLCRLDRRFLPMLYNRRHAGVTMALLALVHAALVILTYHAGGDTNPILGIFKGSPLTASIAGVPFQPFGFFALVILLLMAATSHDFWLANLSAPVWKSLHMLVYLAYGLLVLHVTFGALQAEANAVYVALTATGFITVLGLHITAAFRERPADQELPRGTRRDEMHPANSAIRVAIAKVPECGRPRPQQRSAGERSSTFSRVFELLSLLRPWTGALRKSSAIACRDPKSELEADGSIDACAVADIPEKRARNVCLSGERVAIFKYDGKISAVSNVCQHQNGPLGEGKILDGCITCPWHGYQYMPETGASPPPFIEEVPTFNVRVSVGRVFVHPKPNPPGTRAEPALLPTTETREMAMT